MFNRRPPKRPAQNASYSFPAPISGLLASEALLDLPSDACSNLVNWIAYPDRIETRPGFAAHSTGYANPVLRLHVYSSVTGTQSLWATTATGVYNATSAGAVGALAIALTNGVTVGTSIATGAGSYLLLVNGVNQLKQYDGTTWSSVATFGGTATSIYSYIETYRQRIFLIKKDSLEIEYLAANAIAGAATNYPLGALFRQGGYLVALGTWTIDGGSGPEDQLAAVSSNGEVAIFAGSDPTTWSLRGVYALGKPIGNQCLYKFGGDLLFLCELGIVPLSQCLQGVAIERTQIVTKRVQTLFNAAIAANGNLDGWQIISQPIVPLLIINVPNAAVPTQLVMHNQSGAWSTFQGWNAKCFARMGSTLYYGTTNAVNVVGALNDAGAQITASFTQASNNLSFMKEKQIKLLKPYFISSGGFSYDVGISSDLQAVTEYTTLTPILSQSVSLWGSATWGVSLWNALTTLIQGWETVPDSYGTWKALVFQVRVLNTVLKYYGSDAIYVRGNRL